MTVPMRAAVYRPLRRSDGRAARGPDEDAFTLAAAAIEAVVADSSPADGWEIVASGAAVQVPDTLFAGLLGTTVRVRRAPDTPPEPSGPTTLFVAVDLAETNGVAEDRAVVARGDAIVAGAGGNGPTGDADRLIAAVSGVSPAEVAVLGGVATRADSERAGSPPAGTGTDDRSRVSEGALLPRARYLEGIPSHWRFEGERCEACGRVGFPIRGRCRNCGRADRLVRERLPRAQLPVLAVTRIGPGAQPTEFDTQVERSGGYPVVLVELGPNARATLQGTDGDRGTFAIGDRVNTALRRTYAMEGEWRYARKAVATNPRT
ncbi:MAG TPA: zinc ribbon domain-containing protein [Thermoplasmata archaeon]|nr:zinc ribbon domain-containing protein [Thermoplasmata archaeon]